MAGSRLKFHAQRRERTVPAAINRQILLVEVPQGKLGVEHFALREAEMPRANDGEVRLAVRYISLDAANRAWMQGATSRDAVVAGSVMGGAAVAQVVECKAPAFQNGEGRAPVRERGRITGLVLTGGRAACISICT